MTNISVLGYHSQTPSFSSIFLTALTLSRLLRISSSSSSPSWTTTSRSGLLLLFEGDFRGFFTTPSVVLLFFLGTSSSCLSSVGDEDFLLFWTASNPTGFWLGLGRTWRFFISRISASNSIRARRAALLGKNGNKY